MIGSDEGGLVKAPGSFGALDATLFTLVLVTTAGAGAFQGWLEAVPRQHQEKVGLGLAMPRGRGPINNFLYLATLTCSAPFILGMSIFSEFQQPPSRFPEVQKPPIFFDNLKNYLRSMQIFTS